MDWIKLQLGILEPGKQDVPISMGKHLQWPKRPFKCCTSGQEDGVLKRLTLEHGVKFHTGDTAPGTAPEMGLFSEFSTTMISVSCHMH